MKIKYRDINFKPESLTRIVQIDGILQEYVGRRVTVRQLYYRLVATGVVANKQEEYDRVQDIVTRARYAGLIDWDAIEDRNRGPLRPEEWESGQSALTEVAEKFRIDRWKRQPFYVEIWVEKAALVGVLWPIARDYHVTLMPNRGYSSASAMKERADVIQYRSASSRPAILYVGDHDPSGEDMVRDVQDRLFEFGCSDYLSVCKVALTMEQIEQYQPPPNPAKLSDSRAAGYIAKHGASSWEVDALPPNDLELIVRRALNAYIDKPLMKAAIARENLIKKQIATFKAGFKEPK